jgi:hypothetical protein
MNLALLRHAAVAAIAFVSPAAAQDITLAYGSAVTSIDPLFHNLSFNINFSLNLFDRLIDQDERQRLKPGSQPNGSPSTTRPGNSSCAPACTFMTAVRLGQRMWWRR